LALARRKHPGAANSLDALCDRYRIDRSRRVKHGALLDAEILVDVYCELCGGRQRSLVLASETIIVAAPRRTAPDARPAPLPPRLDEASEAAHRAYFGTFSTEAIWLKYLPAHT
jgi:DNA polymerase-3 subunit epsilon